MGYVIPNELLAKPETRASRLVVCIALSALVTPAGIAGAADAPQPEAANIQGGAGVGQLAEVVVTAQKRAESLQNVPLSVAALTSDALEQRGISGVGSLMSGDIPSLKVEPFAGNQSVLEVSIRGFINPNGSDITNENPVPIYIDDVYYGRQISTALELNDLDRIEVLRGPQGTLFGKNAAGGAVRLISKEPTGEFGVTATAEGGNLGYWKGTGHINLPEVAGLSAKIDLLATGDNGWTTNPAPGQHNYGITESTAGKLTLLYKPVHNARIEYAGDYTDLKSTEIWNAQVSTTDPYHSIWPDQPSTPRSEPWDTYRPLDPQNYWGHRLTGSIDLPNDVTIKSITAYRKDNATLYNTSQVAAALPGPFLSPTFRTQHSCVLGPVLCNGVITGSVPIYAIRHHQLSEELQVTGKEGAVDWVTGLFYLQEAGSQFENTYLGTLLPNALQGTLATGYLPLAPISSTVLSPLFGPVATAGAEVHSKSYAAFGQATWKLPILDEKLAVTAGVRLGRDEKSAVRPAQGGSVWATITYPPPGSLVAPNALPCPQTPQCSPSIQTSRVLPLGVLTYNWTPDISSYFRFSTGYQAPGLSVGSQTFRFVAESTVDSYEFGVKSELFEHTLRANLAVFYLDWNHPQQAVQTTSSSTVEFFNGPTIHTTGAELDLLYLPLKDLTLEASGTLLHSEHLLAANPFANPYSGTGSVQVPFNIAAQPKWATSLSATYDVAHSDYGVLRLNAQANGTDSYYAVPNAPIMSGYWLINARASLSDITLGKNGGNLDLSLWVRNLTDKSYRIFQYETPGTIAGKFNVDAAYGMPRTFGATATYKFQ